MGKPTPILNKKTVTEVVRRTIDKATGEWTEDQIKAAVRNAFKVTAEDLKFLFEALIDASFASAISSLTGPAKMLDDKQIDWVGWENTIIRLGGKRYVRLEDAEEKHVTVRMSHVSDNALKVAASAHAEVTRLKEVLKEMKEKDLKTVGKALLSLGYVQKKTIWTNS